MTPPEQESVEALQDALYGLENLVNDPILSRGNLAGWAHARFNEAHAAAAAMSEKLTACERERDRLADLHLERTKTADTNLRALIARAEVAERERDELGNKLAQERSKPGGSFDQWAALQDAEERVRVAESCIGFCEQWASHPDMQEARAQIQERIARYRTASLAGFGEEQVEAWRSGLWRQTQ